MKQHLTNCRRRASIWGCVALVCCLTLSTTTLLAQTSHQVTGVVRDQNTPPSPIVGAMVVEKGTVHTVITGSDGTFTIDVSSPEAVLVVSGFGYRESEINVSSRSQVDVVLREDIIAIERVISIGYGSMKRSDLTGAVSSISSDLLDNKPISSFDNALRGQIAGVRVSQSDGQPGGGSSIRIRGTTSINGTNEPLYVIDGIPLASEGASDGQGLTINPLASISNNDIESIEVLKDASATAIYGARGANGVILVTTKKGSQGKGAIRYSSTLSFQNPVQTYTLLDGPQLAQLGKEAYQNAAMAVPAYFQDPESVVTRTNWMEEIFRPAMTQNHQLSFSGGTDKINYNFSAGYFDQEGVLITTGFKRYSFRGQVNADVNRYISMGSSVGYTKLQSDGYGNASGGLELISMAIDMNPALPVFDENGEYTFRNNLSSSTGVMGGNPVATAMKGEMQNRQNRFTGNMFADIKFLGDDRLVFRTSLGLDETSANDRLFLPSDLAVSADGPGKGNVSNFTNSSWVLENTLTFRNTWGKHDLTAMVGQTTQEFTQHISRLGSKDFEDNRLGYHDLSLGKVVAINSTTDSAWQMLSYISRIHYSFDDRYLVTFTGRVDGSSKFGVANKYGFFPSGAVAWRISEENFMEEVDFVSNLKLRLSYGTVGNAGIAPYLSHGNLISVSPPYGQGVSNTGLAPMTLPNADLAWESTSQFDVGIDVGFFDNRLNLTADFYRKNTYDLLSYVQLPWFSGYKTSMRNLGDLSNTGFELSLSAVPFDGKDFEWTTTLNFDTNVTRLVSINLAGSESSLSYRRNMIDNRMGNIWGYKTNGIAQLDEDLTQVAQWPNRPMVAGEQKYVDSDDNGIYDAEDEKLLGSSNPMFTFGFNNRFTWRNFNANLFLEGSYGNKIINATRQGLESMTGAKNNITTVLDRWTPQNTGASMPRADVVSNSNAFSDRWIEDGSYVRIRDLTIGYTIPRHVLGDIVDINLFASFENLLTITKYTGNDPAIGGGYDSNLYPTTKKYSLGLSMTF